MKHQLRVQGLKGTNDTPALGLELSTYDMPRSANAEFDRTSDTLSIFFRYIDQEPATTQSLNDRLRIEFGKHSGKVLTIHVKAHPFQEVHVMVRNLLENVDQALDQRIATAPQFNRKLNYALVQSVLNDVANRLVVTEAATEVNP